MRIRLADEADRTEISVLVVSAFGQPNELRLIEALRAEGAVAAELVAETDEGLSGHVLLSWLNAPQGWMTLGPVSVRPPDQSRGVGRDLVLYALDTARRKRAKAVVVVGDPTYYHRFGFLFEDPPKITSPYPAQFTGVYPIAPGAASAQVALAFPKPFETV